MVRQCMVDFIQILQGYVTGAGVITGYNMVVFYGVCYIRDGDYDMRTKENITLRINDDEIILFS